MQKNIAPDTLSQAMAEPSRRALLEQLRLGQKSVGELVRATQLKQPNVSNHLAKMREQGLVRAERIGRQVYYALATPYADVMMRLHEATTDPMALLAASAPAPSEFPAASLTGDGPGKHLAASPHEPASYASHTMDISRDETTRALVEWQRAYFDCVLAGQEARAAALVNAMLARRVEMGTIYTEVFQKSLNQVGDLFLRGETDEAHEHLASAITEQMMTRVAHFYAPVARSTYRALLGCVQGNWHTLGLRMLSDGLKGLGWETLFLGANVPTASFVTMAASMSPDLVIISCAMADQWPDARTLLESLDDLRRRAPEAYFQIVAGGHYLRVRPEAASEAPFDFTAHDLPEFLEAASARFPAPRSPHIGKLTLNDAPAS